MRCNIFGIHIGLISCMTQFYDIFGIRIGLIHYMTSRVFCALHRESEGCTRTLCRYLHILSPQPHLHIPIAYCRPAVPDEPPRWHVHPTHVASRQWLHSLLYHRYMRPEIPEHEMFPQPPRTV